MKSILLVDDDPSLRKVMSQLLETMGDFQVHTAASLSEVKALQAIPFAASLILLDIQIGYHEPSGIDIYHWLRKNGYQGKVVFFTGHARSHPLVQQAMQVSDVELLEKPMGVDRIEKILNEG